MRIQRTLTGPRAAAALCTVALAACAQPNRSIRQLSPEARRLLDAGFSTYGGVAGRRLAESAEVGPPGLPDQLASLLPSRMRTNASHDPALDLVAAVYARSWGEQGHAPVNELGRWMTWRAGGNVEGPLVGFHSATDRDRDYRRGVMLEEMARKLEKWWSDDHDPFSFGIAEVQTGQRRYSWAIAYGARVVDVEVSKRVSAGASVAVSGRLLVPCDDPTLVVDRGGADIVDFPLATAPDGSFRASFDAPSRPGRYFIGITAKRSARTSAERDRSPRRLLLVPIYVDVEEPAEPDPAIRAPMPLPADRSQWEERLLALYNAERQELGRPPLRLEAGACAVARERLEKRRRGESMPTLEDMRARLNARDVQLGELRHYEWTADSLEEAAWIHFIQPWRRQFLLDPGSTAVGLALEPAPNGKVRAVEVFYQPVAASSGAPPAGLDP